MSLRWRMTYPGRVHFSTFLLKPPRGSEQSPVKWGRWDCCHHACEQAIPGVRLAVVTLLQSRLLFPSFSGWCKSSLYLFSSFFELPSIVATNTISISTLGGQPHTGLSLLTSSCSGVGPWTMAASRVVWHSHHSAILKNWTVWWF